MGVFNWVADRSTLLSLCLQWSMSNIMTKAAVKQTLKAKIQGLIARGVDVDEIDQDDRIVDHNARQRDEAVNAEQG